MQKRFQKGKMLRLCVKRELLKNHKFYSEISLFPENAVYLYPILRTETLICSLK